MGLYHQFHAAVTFGNSIPFIQVQVYKFHTITQSPCLEGFDGDHFI